MSATIRLHEAVDQELRSLYPLGIDAIRRGLNSPDIKIALRAADQLFRALGKYRNDGDHKESESAEDVIARILKRVEGDPSVQSIEDRRRDPSFLIDT